MKWWKLIVITIIAFIIATLISVKILFQSNEILVKFNIVSVTNTYTKYKIKVSKVNAAEYYQIEIHDSNNNRVFDYKTLEEETEVDLNNLIYNETYSLMVYAYDKTGDFRPCEEAYIFTFNEPTFDKTKSILLSNQNYDVTIIGDIDNYYLKIYSNETLINEIKLESNLYPLTNDLYKGEEKVIKLELVKDNYVVDKLLLYNNLNPISDISITTPYNNSIIFYNDFTLSYDGGDNALEYKIEVFKDDKIIKTSKTKKKSVILSKNIFSLSSSYLIKVTAVNESYFKMDSINISFSDQVQLSPVYVSNNWKSIKKGTKLELKVKDSDALIYYTLNGDDPNNTGILYTEPIEINSSCVLKTIAKKEGFASSIISEYNVNVSNKDNLIIYLSPSNQHGNIGVSSVGYTNEMDEMNDLTNYIEERLKEYNVTVIRNNPAGNIRTWNKESNYNGADLHLAIHSNASVKHNVYGIETWIHKETSQTYSLANLIQENLIEIYPYKTLDGGDRGVRYANGALGEVNDDSVHFGILVEVAHHDYEDDAKWIMKNKKEIGYTIADAVLKYYQIIE